MRSDLTKQCNHHKHDSCQKMYPELKRGGNRPGGDLLGGNLPEGHLWTWPDEYAAVRRAYAQPAACTADVQQDAQAIASTAGSDIQSLVSSCFLTSQSFLRGGR